MDTKNNRRDMTSKVHILLELASKGMHWYSVIDFVLGKTNPIKAFPQDLSDFGVLKDESPATISNLMHYLLNESYIEFPESGKFLLGLTKRGIYCLKEKKLFYINPYLIRRPWGSYMFEQFLNEERKKIAEARGVAVYEMMPKFIVECIAIAMPKTESELKELPIWSDKFESQWVMEAVKLFKTEWNNPMRLATYPSYQETKALFCSGKNPEEIAELRKTKRDRIIEQLMVLHHAKEIDLSEWAMKYYEKKNLSKCIQYFQKMKVQLLKPAFEMLHIEYEVLKMGRLLAQTA